MLCGWPLVPPSVRANVDNQGLTEKKKKISKIGTDGRGSDPNFLMA